MIKALIIEKIADLHPGTDFDVLVPPSSDMGDYSTNIAFALAKKENKNPVEKAKEIIEKISEKLSEDLEVKLAGPYINIFFSRKFLQGNLSKIIHEKEKYGSQKGNGKKINLEFISANPTGPLTVGNARAGAYGDVIGNILGKSGYDVTKEYYVNDVGVQVRKLAESVINKELEQKGKEPKYKDEDLYKGVYIKDVTDATVEIIGPDLDNKDFKLITDTAIGVNIKSAGKSVKDLGVKIDEWFKESSLHASKEVEETLGIIKKNGKTFERDGATWLNYGDGDEDVAVLVKSDGSTSYLMNDLAYTRNKLVKRGFEKAINIWGADHHGDVARLSGGARALGIPGEKLEIILHQLVAVKKDGQIIRMSKREGNLETLDDLIKEAGRDAVRYFFLLKDLSTHMEFDINLAKEQSNRNPVYYIQYAGARLNSIFEKSGRESDAGSAASLKEKEEIELLRIMAKFPDLLEDVSKSYHVHHFAQYTYELAAKFHKFYELHRVIQDNKEIEKGRITLSLGVNEILKQSLGLMGISMPSKM
jgi:arginyl-tRNA synthetase